MKKLLFAVLFAMTFFTAQNSFAQLTAGLSVGYGPGISKQNYYDARYRDNNTNTREAVTYSLGKGTSIDAIIGYGLNDNIELNLGVSYLMGSSTESVDYDGRDVGAQTDTYTIKGGGINVIPGVTIKGAGETIVPYSRVGMIVGFLNVSEAYNFDDGTNVFDMKFDYSKGTAYGFSGAAGAMYNMGSLQLFGEMFINSQAYAPAERQITEISLDGVDQLSDFTYNELNTIFLDTIDRDKNIADSEPDEELTIYFPFSNAGAKFGVRFTF